jgi:hypothetical protein
MACLIMMGHGVSGGGWHQVGTKAFVKARPAISYTLQVLFSMGEEVAPILDDHSALGYVLAEQPAFPVAPLMHWRRGSKWKTEPDSVLRSHRTEAAVVHWTGDLSGDNGESACACELSAKPVTRSMISV